ncbi:MAG: Uma2 family endonuclease [Defluviitaleaceae bacterium]|nr:Uma2 family endonuclease [Defluviitaleaceae bacterium]MCL2262133.1 Uma2 family endonuclease [Defluviitaleaceae bacterium]
MLAEKLERYTYADYLEWGEDVKCELIDGIIYNMASPSARHQDVVFELGSRFKNFLRGRRCKTYLAPLDVRLNAHSFDDTIVQPDIIILCDRTKLDPKGRGIIGAPDMVVEVMSPSTAYKDRALKHKKYMDAGIKEYWIADSENNTMEVYLLENGKYYSRHYGGNDKVPVQVLPKLEIDLGEVFAEEVWGE